MFRFIFRNLGKIRTQLNFLSNRKVLGGDIGCDKKTLHGINFGENINHHVGTPKQKQKNTTETKYEFRSTIYLDYEL